ncbi:MAG TPA: DUF885 domain-containing protein, partial [Nitrospirota bacterium]|nr:DUF885 domain-containing protein [Nitrospirota bacterium]
YFAAHPDAAVYAGRHEFDGRLPDWSRTHLDREVRRLRKERERALSFNPADLDERRRFERDYLTAVIDGKLFWLTSAEWPYKNPVFYERALDPNVYLTRAYAPLSKRMDAYIRYAKAIPNAARQIRANLRPPLPRPFIAIGRSIFGGLASYYEKDVPAAFSSVKDAKLQKDFSAANEKAIGAMEGLAAWLGSLGVSATEDFALGPDRFREMFWATERVNTPLENLERIARQDLERNTGALREACAAYAPGMTIPECIAMVQENKPEAGAVAEARRQLAELKTFIREKEIVTIPGEEEARVAESPPYKRWNLAYIDIPGPYEKNLPSTYYIAPPDPSWSKAEQSAYVPGRMNLLFVSVHEVWPGHFLQFLHAHRTPSKFGQVFVGYAFAEGWAHYAEEMMWDAGLGGKDPETHIGQLMNALLRDVRFISAVGLHTGRMTVAESERMFRESAYEDPGNARQQAERGTFDPAYLNYTVGKLMIRKLREDWTASRGGRRAWREFHDRFLSFGGPPIPLVRAAMMGTDSGPLF